MNAANIADKLIGLLALGAVLFYVFKDGKTTSSIIGSAAGGFGAIEGALQGSYANQGPNIGGIPGLVGP